MEREDALRKITKLNNELIRTQRNLAQRNAELEAKNHELSQAKQEIDDLRSMLPVCMHCKKIRGPDNQWFEPEQYIKAITNKQFSHGICDGCMTNHYPSYAMDQNE